VESLQELPLTYRKRKISNLAGFGALVFFIGFLWQDTEISDALIAFIALM
jgi:hypothetical protein